MKEQEPSVETRQLGRDALDRLVEHHWRLFAYYARERRRRAKTQIPTPAK